MTDDDSGGTGQNESVLGVLNLQVVPANFAPYFSGALAQDLKVEVGSILKYQLPAVLDLNLLDEFTFLTQYDSGS